MRRIVKLAASLSIVLAAAACDAGEVPPDPAPTAPATGSTIGSASAFQEFSGLTVPASATNIAVRVTTGPTGKPAYRATFNLPSADIDQFCVDGQLNRPLQVVTIPESFRKTFDYRGDSSTGVSIAEGSLPSNVDVQRQVFAVGTKKTVAEVRVYAFTMAG